MNSLAQIAQLRVTPRSIAFRYKARVVDPQMVGRELNVRVALTGRVIQRGDNLVALATRSVVIEEAPEATELIYDAYNAVATGYTFTGRPSDAFIHIAVYARWVNLGFNRGSQLDDPHGVLQGTGRWIRHIRISEPADLEKPVVRELVKGAVARAARPDPQAVKSGAGGSKSVVRAIYPKRRRPVITG